MGSVLNLLVLIVLCVIVTVVFSDDTNECVIPGKIARQADYYWRDYAGVVPDDAIEGGFTQAGNVTYIAHFRHNVYQGIFVGNIYAGKKEAVGAFDGKSSHSTYVLILCSGKKNRFEWRQANVDDLHLLSDYHLVRGGIYNDTVLYIGRANVDDQVKVGHVYPKSHGWKGLWVFKDNNGQENFNNFEILVLPR